MKKILTILFISFSVAAQSQVLQTPQIFGTLYRNLGAKEGLVVPTFCGTPTLPPSVKNYRQSAIAYDSCNHIFYVFSPTDSTWKTISGSGLDSLAHRTWVQATDSSYLGVKNLKNNVDTLVVLAPDGVIAAGGGGANTPSYKVYTALLTVSDSAAIPTAVVMENTLGVTVTYSRQGVGWYKANLSSPLNGDKMVFICRNEVFTPPSLFDGAYIDDSTINLYVRDINGTPNDNALYRAFFEIRVYN